MKLFKIVVTLNNLTDEDRHEVIVLTVPEDQVVPALRNIMTMYSYLVAKIEISPTRKE